jgi:hypothetical protein
MLQFSLMLCWRDCGLQNLRAAHEFCRAQFISWEKSLEIHASKKMTRCNFWRITYKSIYFWQNFYIHGTLLHVLNSAGYNIWTLCNKIICSSFTMLQQWSAQDHQGKVHILSVSWGSATCGFWESRPGNCPISWPSTRIKLSSKPIANSSGRSPRLAK